MTSTDKAQLPTPASEREDMQAFGPALASLTPKQRAFALAYVAGATQAEAVRAAGYSTANETVISVAGTRLAHHPRIQAALHEEAFKMIRSSGPKAIITLQSLAFDAAVKPRDRITAALALLDRGGLGATTQHRVDVFKHEPSRAEVRARLAAACDELGFTPEMKARAMRISAMDLVEQKDGSFSADEQVTGEPTDEVEQVTEIQTEE
jgi:hypothetical protein